MTVWTITCDELACRIFILLQLLSEHQSNYQTLSHRPQPSKMSAMFGMPGIGASSSAIPQPPKSRLQKFKESPLYTIVINGGLFVAGVAFIQSPLMEMMAPQL